MCTLGMRTRSALGLLGCNICMLVLARVLLLMHPCCRVKLLGHEEEHTTEVKKKNANPTFNQLLVFKTESMAGEVDFEVFHKDKDGKP